jgi:TPP-dependent pyruvate/acetoin dehydrogenase alpha subunit
VQVDKLLAVKMYRNMVLLQTMDTLFYEAQRQGQFTFYVTTIGEEAINIASAAALSNDDIVYAQVCCVASVLVVQTYTKCNILDDGEGFSSACQW